VTVAVAVTVTVTVTATVTATAGFLGWIPTGLTPLQQHFRARPFSVYFLYFEKIRVGL
jgi:hypothetical protein